jgi:hypothetical protein
VAFVDDHVAHAEAAAREALASALRIGPDESQEIRYDVRETLFPNGRVSPGVRGVVRIAAELLSRHPIHEPSLRWLQAPDRAVMGSAARTAVAGTMCDTRASNRSASGKRTTRAAVLSSP